MLEPRATARKQHVVEAAGPTAPRPRRYEGAYDGAKVRNADPTRHYVLVYTPQVDEYAENDYMIELVREGGPMVGAGVTAKAGEPVQYRGHILMSISKESLRDQVINGSLDGHAFGQKWADAMEERILQKDGGNDPLRGIGGSYMRVDRNDPNYVVTPVQPEYGI
ncbi:MAG: hypothetical protein NW202_13450 [Nitrospira sp.]|nr:hypothetical protein [Nitrospira sp.]